MPSPLPSFRFLSFALIAALTSCATSPEPNLRGPEIDAQVTYYAGDPIGGAVREAEALAFEPLAKDAMAVVGKLYLVKERPGDRFAPMSRHVRMIVAGGGAQPLESSSLLTAGTRLATGADAVELARTTKERPASQATLCAEFDGLSFPGVTTQMVAAHAQPIELSGYRPSQRRVSVELWREDPLSDVVSIALIIWDVGESLEDRDDGSPVIRNFPRQERLVLDAKLNSSERTIAIFAPTRFDPEAQLSYLLVVELDEVAPELDEERLELVMREVHEAGIAGSGKRQKLLFDDLLRVRHRNAIQALGDESHQRAALVELAGGAPVASELGLMADEPTLARLLTRVAPKKDRMIELAGDVDGLAWLLERESISMFLKALSEQSLAPEYAALLLQHTGEAGRLSWALESALANANSVQEFYAMILEENRIALEDSSPSARVRAHDWLQSRNLAVDNYDPLAERPQRRVALQEWADQQAEAKRSESGEGEVKP